MLDFLKPNLQYVGSLKSFRLWLIFNLYRLISPFILLLLFLLYRQFVTRLHLHWLLENVSSMFFKIFRHQMLKEAVDLHPETVAAQREQFHPAAGPAPPAIPGTMVGHLPGSFQVAVAVHWLHSVFNMDMMQSPRPSPEIWYQGPPGMS